ncbi:MAG: hypothetical protein SPH41_05705 [Bacilli bacterium]|nr:hypothetical protein [Bacilli bacterium]
MSIIRLPIDIKSLYFNIKNDNLKGHTPTVASPLKKVEGLDRLENILVAKKAEIDISTKEKLVELLIKHSKTKVVIRNMFVFNKLFVNGKQINPNCSFGCYIKEEVDETKVQFGRLKLHYPPKLIYEDCELNINNKKVFKEISAVLGNYAFIIRSFEYNSESNSLNFDALIVGENNIPYSKVFINEKGVGMKFNSIFNENADDYDREIIALKKEYGDKVNPYNYLEFTKTLKIKALEVVKQYLNKQIEYISESFPYSLFDFCYLDNGIRKYGFLRITATKNNYFNLSFVQQLFLMDNRNDADIFLVTDVLNDPKLFRYNYEQLSNLTKNINSIKYEDE